MHKYCKTLHSIFAEHPTMALELFNEKNNQNIFNNSEDDFPGKEKRKKKQISTKQSNAKKQKTSNMVKKFLISSISNSILKQGCSLHVFISQVSPDIYNKDTLSHENSPELQHSFQQSIRSHEIVLQNIARKELFARVKFISKMQLNYSEKEKSICGFVMNQIHAFKDKPAEWKHEYWGNYQKIVLRAHTQQRNNCVKSIAARYIGESICNVCN